MMRLVKLESNKPGEPYYINPERVTWVCGLKKGSAICFVDSAEGGYYETKGRFLTPEDIETVVHKLTEQEINNVTPTTQ